MPVIGYLKITENFIYKGGRGLIEYNRGQLIEVWEYDRNRYSLLINEGIVEYLDANKKPCTYEELSDKFYKQGPGPLMANKVPVSTRPVKVVTN